MKAGATGAARSASIPWNNRVRFGAAVDAVYIRFVTYV